MQQNRLHYETITPLLRQTLETLMSEKLFAPFRLVGGTNLSLRYGHRKSDDIDLFTDAEYGSLNYNLFEQFLRDTFNYYDCSDHTSIIGFGRGYYIGDSAENVVKLDLMYTDPFIESADSIDGIRLAHEKDIIAMKMNVVSRGGRKKDFWDLHLLFNNYTLTEMFEIHARRHQWEHDTSELLERLTDFSIADSEFDPICLLGKDWDDIKLDLIELVDSIHQY